MSKSIMLSIRPKWCKLIIDGVKTIEVRKTRPMNIDVPFRCYIYCTQPDIRHRTICGHMVLNDDELFRLPSGEYKYGDSVEMMLYTDYSKDNFLNGKVIGEFTCDCIVPIAYTMDGLADYVDCTASCLMPKDFIEYGQGMPLYGWHISELNIYEHPKELSDFYLNRAPQSWNYIY